MLNSSDYAKNYASTIGKSLLPPPYFMTSPLMHGQIFSYVLRGGGGTRFVQVVGEIRSLILELEKYFLCEPLRAPTQKSVTA